MVASGLSVACSRLRKVLARVGSSGCSAPPRSAAEAALAGIEPVPLRHLAEAAAYLRGEPEPPPYDRRTAARLRFPIPT